jgi:flagellar biosynthetic protein FlhB
MDLSGAMVFLGTIIAMRMALSNGTLFSAMSDHLHQCFSFDPHPYGFSVEIFRYWQIQGVTSYAKELLPILGVAYFVGLAVNVAQVGMVVSLQSANPDWTRVSPAKGFERMFSARGTVELLKGIAKMLMIGIICWTVVTGNLAHIIQSATLPLPMFLSIIGQIIWDIAIRVAVLLAIIAGADYVFQKMQYEKMMRMSREEMKQESKQQEGDPLIKRRIRMKQRELAKNRMMHDVPKADVVITNPTHFAVALMYDPKTMSAPRVVAKGTDEVAQQIKRIAQESSVPLVENRQLARELYKTVKLGKDVPSHLFRAVAEVLAFIYRTYGKRTR